MTKVKVPAHYIRLLLHSFFWIIMLFFFIYLKMPLLGLTYRETALVAIKDIIIIALIFYFISYYVIPQGLLKRRFFLLLLSILAIYYFYAITVFLEFSILPRIITIPGRGYQAYSQRVLPTGFIGIFRFKNVAEILLDMSYLLSPALIIKLFVRLFNLSTQALKLERDNLNLELAFLKAQINPHFLFNTLNNVYSLALHKSERTADIVLKLSDLMRYTLYDSNTSVVLLGKEIQFLKNYIELERIRHGSRVTISFEIQGNCNSLSIAPLIIFPFMENAFKHGINSSMVNSWVTIKLFMNDSTLNVLIKNSRFPKKRETDAVGGIGISNTKKRLNLLYPNKHILEIEESNSYFLVDLAIQLT